MKTKQDLLIREKEYREVIEENTKLSKEIISLKTKENHLLKEIKKEEAKLIKLSKNLAIKPEEIKLSDPGISRNQATLSITTEIIHNYFECLQKYCNASYQEKYKKQIEYLYSLQKDMKVSYITVKKLDMTQEFLMNFNLIESINTFENLNNLSKIGRLNYSTLKPCGPILIFRLDLDLTFDKLKEKCCETWSLSSSMHCLYDEAFTNLECCKFSNLIDYFSSYQAYDYSMEQGQVCFYLIDKLKHQRELFQLQERSNIFIILLINIYLAIDSKSEAKEDFRGNSNNFEKNQLEECMELIKENKILKGIHNYRIDKYEDSNKKFLEMAKMVDNNLIYIILNIVIIIFSLISISSKENVVKWSNTNWENRYLLTTIQSSELLDMPNYLEYFIEILKQKSDYYPEYDNILMNFFLYGPVRVRFFRTQGYECIDQITFKKLNLLDPQRTCYYPDHNSDTWNSTGLLNYTFRQPNETNIKWNRVTPFGNLDKAGILIDISTLDVKSFKKSIDELYIISDKNNKYITLDIQAIELQCTVYDANTDIFITNLILVQRDINGSPLITISDSIPFVTSMYETKSGKSIKGLDVLRLIFLFLVISSIPIRIIQKYRTSTNKKGMWALIKIIITVVLQFKHLLLLFSIGFMLAAFTNFNNNYLETEKYNLTNEYFDFYYFAYRQKIARNWEQLSLCFIFIYSLKYLQYFQSIRIILISFKKASFEYFLLLVIICLLIVALSFLTNFVYGTYVYECRNFLEAMTLNIKQLIFIENTDTVINFLKYNAGFSVFIYVIFVFVFKYFFIYLFLPIFVEYFRIEYDKMNNSMKADYDEKPEKMSLKAKLCFLIFPCNKDKRKKKLEDVNNQI